MTFLNPFFLFGLTALIIPIAVHLFNFRRYKTVFFSNVRFLKAIQEETIQQSKLKHLLILLCRCLAFIFIVLAFAQPIIPHDKNTISNNKGIVSIFIDNSQSMNAEGVERNLLDAAKQTAKDIVLSSNKNNRFQIIDNNLQGHQQHLLSNEEALNMIDEVSITPESKSLQTIFKKQKEALAFDNTSNKNIYFLSDFQSSQFNMVNDTNYKLNFVPFVNENKQNIFIDTCWFEAPCQVYNQTVKLFVRIKNSGENDYDNVRLTLDINEKVKSIEEFEIKAGSVKIDTFNFKLIDKGWNRAKVGINDFPITFDDQYFLAFEVLEKVNVLILESNSENKYINACFKDEIFGVTHQKINSVNYNQFGNANLIILNDIPQFSTGFTSEIIKYLKKGGNICIIPPLNSNIESYNQFNNSLQIDPISSWNNTPAQVGSIELDEGLLGDVFEKFDNNQDLPNVAQYLNRISQSKSIKEAIVKLKNGQPIISKFKAFQKSNIYVFDFPLDIQYTSIPNHSLFAPLMYKIAITGAGNGIQSYIISSNRKIEIKNNLNSDAVLKIKNDKTEFIPTQYAFGNMVNLQIDEHIKQAGFYKIINDKGEIVSEIGLNYDRKESILSYNSSSEIMKKYNSNNIKILDNASEGISHTIKEMDMGKALWKYCVWLVLVFLLLEIFTD